MLKNKHINKICLAVIALTVLAAIIFIFCASKGWIGEDSAIDYQDKLFDTATVHTIDIVMDDWDGFLNTCTSEEYASCTVVIDGESYANVAIRGKGNTSLTSVASYGNDRYSFKIEFDHYNAGSTYHGLDKLSLNNIISDNTYLKDYLCYQMMGYTGIAAPLSSFVYITVNGEDWGLYLAVEGVEESFLQRNYGKNYGELYKPDSMSFGAGRGNGAQFDINELVNGSDQSGRPQQMPDNFDPAAFAPPDTEAEIPTSGEQSEEANLSNNFTPPDNADTAKKGNNGFGGMGSADVKLQYIDDDADSYTNIFDNAKTDITTADKNRLIASLRQLSSGTDIEQVVDIEAVIKYFVVHTFVCNDDSYTGSLVHNYYLYEEDGILSMIPWDYNLAFGGMGKGGMGNSTDTATSEVNSPIDSPVSNGDLDDRPMIAWIFDNEEYMELYHQYYQQFIDDYFDSGYFTEMLDATLALISPYVEQDPTAFCTYEEFVDAADTLREFCLLRAESINGQLDGSIPATEEGQQANDSNLIDASHLSLSAMGTFNNGGMGMDGQGDDAQPHRGQQSSAKDDDTGSSSTETDPSPQPPISSLEQAPTEEGATDQITPPDMTNKTDERSDGIPEDFFPGEGPPGNDHTAGSASQWIVLGLSLLVLISGLIIAIKAKSWW